MQLTEWIARIERMQRELTEMHDYHQGYLDRRSGRGITTATDTIMARQQQTLIEAVNLLEALKAEKLSNVEENVYANHHLGNVDDTPTNLSEGSL